MEEFCFVHCADLHLDSPFSGISGASPWLALRLREATFNAFSRVVDVALKNGAAAILIAGDVFDSEYGSLAAQLRFRDIVSRATNAGVAVFVVCGNHDPLKGWMRKVPLPEGVHIFGTEPETRQLVVDGEVVATVSGVSFGQKVVRANLARRMRRPQDSPFAVALLHCNVGGVREHENYAPCSMSDLVDSGFDYWALGHIHKPAVLRRSDPCVVYSGTTQGRTVAETGEHGCYVVSVSGNRVDSLEFVPTDAVRWETVTISIEGISNIWDLRDAVVEEMEKRRAGDMAVLLRLRFVGRGSLNKRLRDEEDLSAFLADLRADEAERDDFVWIAAADVTTSPELDLETLKKGADFIAEFLKVADNLRKSPQDIREILKKQVPRNRKVRQMIEALSDEELIRIIADAEYLGLSMLVLEEQDAD